MRIGLAVRATHHLTEALQEVEEIARAGFASAWFGHFANGYDPLLAIARLGHAAPGLELGVGVAPTHPHHPAALAQQALSANVACGGRLVLGLGVSHAFLIETVFGYRFERPGRHMREYLSILCPLLRERRVEFKGETLCARARLDIRDAPPGPPVLVGALGPRMLELAGELADGVITAMVGAKGLSEYVLPTLWRAAERAGRARPRVVAELPVCLTDDSRAARARLVDGFATYDRMPEFANVLRRQGVERVADVALVGDEEAVTGALTELARAGADDLDAILWGNADEIERGRALLRAHASAQTFHVEPTAEIPRSG